MLDTIKIRLKGVKKIEKPENFTPEFVYREYNDLSETEKKTKGGRLIKKFRLKEEIRNSGRYIPRVEIYEKLSKDRIKVVRQILVEFSVPKLIVDNNLEEISENNYKATCKKLFNVLNDVGVYVDKDLLMESVITSKIHFGKNIILPKKYSMKNIIDNLKVTEMGKSYDVTEVEMDPKSYKNKLKNKNEIFHHFSGSRDYAFYDKRKDILNKKSKSVDKDTTSFEKELIESYDLLNTEIFRYEYRINNFFTIRSEINKILRRSPKEDITLEIVFNEILWRKILINSWNKILDREENQLALKFNGPDDQKDVVRALFIKSTENKKSVHSQNLAFSSYGLAKMAGEFGMKFVRNECEKFWSKRACDDRLRKKIEKAVEFFNELKYPDSITFVDSEIKKFEKVTRDSL